MPDLYPTNLVIDPNTGDIIPAFKVVSSFGAVLPVITAVSPGESAWINSGVGFDIGASLGAPPLHDGPLTGGTFFSLLVQSGARCTNTGVTAVLQYRLVSSDLAIQYSLSNSLWNFLGVANQLQLIPFCALPRFQVPTDKPGLVLQVKATYTGGGGTITAGDTVGIELTYMGFQEA